MTDRVSRNEVLFVICISIFGIAARIWYHFHASAGDFSVLFNPDEKNYYFGGAKLFLEQGWEYFLTERSLWNGPLNVLWVALWGLECIACVKLANLFLLVLTGVCVWDVARQEFGRAAGLLALSFFTLHVPFLNFGPTILAEPPFIFLLTGSGWVLWRMRNRKLLGAFAGGALLGLAALTRPTVQLFPVFLLIALFLLRCLSRVFRYDFFKEVHFKTLVALLVGFAVLVVPWGMKNWTYCGKVGLANGLGAVLYLGTDLRKRGDEPIYSQMDFDTIEITRPYTHLDTEGDRRLVAAAWQQIQRHPLDICLLCIQKAGKFVFFGHPQHYFYPFRDIVSFWKNSSFKRVLIQGFDLVLTVVVAMTGLVGLSLLSSGIWRFFSVSIILYFVCLHALTFPIPRLGLPMFPFLVISSAGLLAAKGRSVLVKRGALGSIVVSGCIVAGIMLWNLGSLPSAVSAKYTNYFSVQQEVKLTEKKLHELKEIDENLFQAEGQDPFLTIQVKPFKAQKNQVLFLELSALGAMQDKKRSKGQAQLFWAAPGSQKFCEEASAAVSIGLNGEKRVYRISPSLSSRWQGTIGTLRLDFPDHMPGGRYTVHSLVLAR